MADFVVPADHRVQLVVPRKLRQIDPVFVHGVVRAFGIIGRHALVAAHLLQSHEKSIPSDAVPA
ncbi:hypothetical protein SDC9_142449 [bioreactor metagenome]|uniref:Uncharacterized protein n=1 Tax=bioreactor metagenome TaxID=1076179 RepID=A0A645E161_9ZZZZ